MAAAAQGQPVKLPAQPGEACAGSVSRAQTLLPQALPFPGFLGSLEAAAFVQRST